MIAAHRLATLADAPKLFALRRRSILALAPPGMSAVATEAWAGALTGTGMKRKLRELEIWVAEVNGEVVAWGAIRHDVLEGLYTDPDFAGRGIGTALLASLEALMRDRGIAAVRADASRNAEAFYYRRGYEPDGPRTPEDAQPIRKRLRVDPN